MIVLSFAHYEVICEYLINVNKKLRPTGEEAQALMEKHVGLVDDTPHVALLYVDIPSATTPAQSYGLLWLQV